MAPIQIEGESTSGVSTNIRALGFNFDLGDASKAISSPVCFISHTHLDHVGALHQYLRLRAMRGMEPATIYLPSDPDTRIEHFLDAAFHLQGDDEPVPLFDLNYVSDGDIFAVGHYRVEVFGTHHRGVPSVGYRIFTIQQKLLPEFAGIDGKEIGKLRKQGVVVTTPVRSNLLVYTGDTEASLWVERPDLLLNLNTLVTECSFTTDDTLERARQYAHTHAFDLLALHHLFEDVEQVVLTHLSVKPGTREAAQGIRLGKSTVIL